MASPGAPLDPEGEDPRTLAIRRRGEEGARWGRLGAARVSRGSSCRRLCPLQTPSQADHLNDQSLFPNGVVSAPVGEVQGSLAVKHAVLHGPDVLRFGREDVLCVAALHPVRNKGDLLSPAWQQAGTSSSGFSHFNEPATFCSKAKLFRSPQKLKNKRLCCWKWVGRAWSVPFCLHLEAVLESTVRVPGNTPR